MGDGKNMIEQAITYQWSGREGRELSSQNRAKVRGYPSTCNICSTLGPFSLIAHSRRLPNRCSACDSAFGLRLH